MTAENPPTSRRPSARARSADPRAPGRRRAWARVAAVALMTLAAVFLVRLADVWLATERAERSEEELRVEVESLRSEVRVLETAVADVQSDEGVERWAREERGFGREGDHTLGVSATVGTTGSVAAAPSSGDSPLVRLRRWLSDRMH